MCQSVEAMFMPYFRTLIFMWVKATTVLALKTNSQTPWYSPPCVNNPWSFNHSPRGIFRPDYAVGNFTFTRKRGIPYSKNRWTPDSQNLNWGYDVYVGATMTLSASFWKMRRVYKA